VSAPPLEELELLDDEVPPVLLDEDAALDDDAALEDEEALDDDAPVLEALDDDPAPLVVQASPQRSERHRRKSLSAWSSLHEGAGEGPKHSRHMPSVAHAPASLQQSAWMHELQSGVLDSTPQLLVPLPVEPASEPVVALGDVVDDPPPAPPAPPAPPPPWMGELVAQAAKSGPATNGAARTSVTRGRPRTARPQLGYTPT
jgi:hypothetical protein